MGYQHTAIALQAPGLTTTERAVLALTAEFTNAEHADSMWHPQEHIADRLEVSREAVLRAFAKAQKLGYVTRYKRFRPTPDGPRRDRDTVQVHHDVIAAATEEKLAELREKWNAKRAAVAVRDEKSHTYVTTDHVLGDEKSQQNKEQNQESNQEDTHVQTAPRPAGSSSVDKAEESKGRPLSKLHPDAVHAWQTAATRPLGLPTEEDLVPLRRHLGREFADWIDESNKRPPRHCAPAATKAENHADHGPYYRAAASLWSLMAQARADAEVAVMRQPAPPEESRTIRVDAGDREKLDELRAEAREALEAGTMLPEFAQRLEELEAMEHQPDSVARRVLAAQEDAVEDDVDELARQSTGLAPAIVVQDAQERPQERHQDASAAEEAPTATEPRQGREEATDGPLDPFKDAATRADLHHARRRPRRLPPGADLVQMHRARLAAQGTADAAENTRQDARLPA